MSRFTAWLLALSSFVFIQAAYASSPALIAKRTGNHDGHGRVVKKTFDITWKTGNPNGNPRKLTHVNGQFPGPDLILDEDDWVEVTVHNHQPFNTTVHWHGLSMPGTPWSDGMPGLTQRPILPGQSYVYKFRATPPGTYWYHSHSHMNMLDGLYGSLFIRRKEGAAAPFHLINNREVKALTAAAADPTLVVLSEWTNFTADQYMKAQRDSELDLFCVDSLLINGKGSVFCPPIEQLNAVMDPGVAYVLAPGNITDKGCFPFVPITQGIFLPGKPEKIPHGLWEGCVATKGSMSKIDVDAKKNNGWLSLNFIMASTMRIAQISIDNHELWLYEVDGEYIEPRKAHAITIYPGQRVAVALKLNQKPADYTIRFADNGAGQIMTGYGVMHYKGGKPLKNYTVGYTLPLDQKDGYLNYGGLNRTEDVVFFETTAEPTPPYPPNPPARPKKGDELFVLKMGRAGAAWKYTMKGSKLYETDRSLDSPLLYFPNSADALDEELVIRTKNGSWVDIVLNVGVLPGEAVEIGHAIHKHGNKFWVIGRGLGEWSWNSTADAVTAHPEWFNLDTPAIKDTAITEFIGAMWVVIRYHSNNPGPWLLHCHVETHLAGGMGIAILDGVDKWPKIPPEYALGRNGF